MYSHQSKTTLNHFFEPLMRRNGGYYGHIKEKYDSYKAR